MLWDHMQKMNPSIWGKILLEDCVKSVSAEATILKSQKSQMDKWLEDML